MEKIIEFKNVTKNYDSQTHALNDVSISIEKGEFAFIVGASGAGKSTFLKLIMHEESPSSGTIIVNGTDVTNLKRKKIPYLRRNMGIVFQDFRLIEKMTVYDNVAFAMRAIGATPAAVKSRVPYILGLVGLSHKLKNRPSELSGGEQQRVSLARALVNNPAIIIADEPTGNIDPEMSYEIIELLTKINEQGTTILVVTHEHELVRQFNKRVIEIDKGRVVNDTKAPDSEFTDYEPVESEEDSDESDIPAIEEAETEAVEEEIFDEETPVEEIPEEEPPEEETPEEEIHEEETPVEEFTEEEILGEGIPEEDTPEEEILEEENSEEEIPEEEIPEEDTPEEEISEEEVSKEESEPTIDDILNELSEKKNSAAIDDLEVDAILAEFREQTGKGGEV